MPPRYYTQIRDEQIYALMREGMHPKEVKNVLNLSTVDIVYKAIARGRLPNLPTTDRRKTHINLPNYAEKNPR